MAALLPPKGRIMHVQEMVFCSHRWKSLDQEYPDHHVLIFNKECPGKFPELQLHLMLIDKNGVTPDLKTEIQLLYESRFSKNILANPDDSYHTSVQTLLKQHPCEIMPLEDLLRKM